FTARVRICILSEQMTATILLWRHVDPARHQTDRFKLSLENLTDPLHARSVLGCAFNVNDAFEKCDGFILMGVDVIDDALLFRRRDGPCAPRRCVVDVSCDETPGDGSGAVARGERSRCQPHLWYAIISL